MGYIKEPVGIDFVVEQTALTPKDKKRISEIIAHYKATGKKMILQNRTIKQRPENKRNKKALA
jgi:hypothetical protein